VDTLLRHDDVIIDAGGLVDIEAAISAHTKTSRHLQVREKLSPRAAKRSLSAGLVVLTSDNECVPVYALIGVECDSV
jgi:hypothetical protein